jgi:hypothetical protein
MFPGNVPIHRVSGRGKDENDTRQEVPEGQAEEASELGAQRQEYHDQGRQKNS